MNRFPLTLAFILFFAVFLTASAQEPSEKEAMELAAKAQERGKEKAFAEAAILMGKAIKASPQNHLFFAMASDFELKAGNFGDGLAHALQAIKLNDKVGSYYVLAAANAYWNQDLDLTREHCNIVIKRGANDVGAVPVSDAKFLLDLLGKKTYTLFFNLDPQKGRPANGVYAVALPKDGLPYQSVTWEIDGVKSQKFAKGDANDLLTIVPKGNNAFPLTIKVTVEPYSFKKELTKATSKPLSKEAQTNLGPILSVDPKSPVLKKIVADLKDKDKVVTVRNIQAWMKKNVEYKLQGTSLVKLDFKSVDEIVKRGHAECRGYALLFTALCRAAEVPARPVWGMLRLEAGADRKFGDIVSHNWAEVYFGGVGWIPIDPQRPETFGFLPTNYLRFVTDGQKSDNSAENLPILNLMFMHGAKLRFEESR